MGNTSIKPFQNEKPVPYSKRIISFVIDALILIVLSIGISFGACAISSNFKSYKDANTTLKQEMNTCYSYVEDSKLYTFTGEGEEHYTSYVEPETLLEQWCYRHIIKSYNVDKTLFEQQGITKLDIDSSITEATYENDNIAYFYVTFVETRNNELNIVDLHGKSTKQYYYDEFKSFAKKDSDGNDVWVFYEDLSLPLLKPIQAFNLYCYYKYSKTNELTKEAYNTVAKTYIEMWNKETSLLSSSSGYQLHYNNYLSNYGVVAKIMNLSVLVAWVFAFFLGYVLPQLIFKTYHQTFGKKIIKIAVVDADGDYMKKWQIIIRNIVKFISLFALTTISNLVVLGTGSTWTYKLFYIGNLGISMQLINVALIIVLFASFIVSIFPYKKRSISDYICHTYEIDVQIIQNRIKAAVEKTLDTYEANL